MRTLRPDYSNCIANLACSVLKYYGITPPNATLPQADVLLSKPYRNVVVLLLDGMGEYNLKMHLKKDGFFQRHQQSVYSSTFPPTTVAATTAMNSGLMPNQSGWLGWVGYFPHIDRNIVYFWNVDNDNGERMSMDVANTYVPYESLPSQLRNIGVEAHYLAPFVPPYPKGYNAFCEHITQLCRQPGNRFIYAYWDEPDHSMHETGVEGENICTLMEELEKRTEKLAGDLKDTLLIITADHGHITTKNADLSQYPEIMNCLVRMPSMEGRALNLFVKEGMKETFEQAFNAVFQNDFWLMPKQQVLREQLLGTGADHPLLEQMLGDYLAVATGDVCVSNQGVGNIGNHAGMTEEEILIPLIAVEC